MISTINCDNFLPNKTDFVFGRLYRNRAMRKKRNSTEYKNSELQNLLIATS
jgi:hypothetical protein